MTVRVTALGVVDCRATLEIPLSAISVWGQIRDFHRYARHDFFHAEIAIDGGVPRPGAKLTLYHRYLGFRIWRTGRILIWREGTGYSFSDLSTRGPRAGFPHVFGYRFEATGPMCCRLHIRVAVARPAVRQKTRVGISPENFVDYIEPFFARCLNDRAPAIGERAFKQRVQRAGRQPYPSV